MATILTEYTDLVEQFTELDVLMKDLKSRMAEMEPKVIEHMAEEGIENIKVNGRVHYIYRDVRTSPKKGTPKEEVAAVLREIGMEDYVKEDYNANSLTAFVRSVEKEVGDGEPLSMEEIAQHLHPKLAEKVTIHELFSLRSRKA